MNKLSDIANNGFMVSETRNNELEIAFISLNLALKSYFSTYKSIKYNLSFLKSKFSKNENVDMSYPRVYYESCAETIIHFQHFFELACKQILKNEHPLLADIASRKAVVLSKLLRGETLSESEGSGLQSIEFSEAILRLVELIKGESIKDYQSLSFIVKREDVLKTVNTLRNRIWHRGLFILRYAALDELVCGFILPLVNEFLSLNLFNGNEVFWKYKELYCGLDPINELINTSTSAGTQLDKIAFIKELGRAAYNNPLNESVLKQLNRDDFSEIFDRASIHKAEGVANQECSTHKASLETCPVCGVKSLVLYPESHYEYDENDDISEVINYIWQINCECCGFSLHSEFENPSHYGFSNIPDFWN